MGGTNSLKKDRENGNPKCQSSAILHRFTDKVKLNFTTRKCPKDSVAAHLQIYYL